MQLFLNMRKVWCRGSFKENKVKSMAGGSGLRPRAKMLHASLERCGPISNRWVTWSDFRAIAR